MLYEPGNVYREADVLPPNGTALGHLFHWAYERPHLFSLLTPEGMERMAGAVRKAAAPLEGVELAAEDGPLILREVRNAVRLLLHLCELGKLRAGLAEGATVDPAQVRRLMRDLDAIMAEHRELWLARNRAGGLAQMSMPPFERLQAGYQETLRFSSDT